MRNNRVIIFEGSSSPPAFIKRLIYTLSENNWEVYLLYFGKKETNKVEGLHYVHLGNNESRFSLIFNLISIGLDSGFVPFKMSLRAIFSGNKKVVQNHIVDLSIKKIDPCLVHVQWPSMLPYLNNTITNRDYPVLLSQRGYQINVRPFLNKSFFNFLENVFPKLAGFHSVSKAISKKGDLIYQSDSKIDEVVYTGIDLREFKFTDGIRNSASFNIISIGRPHWKKSFETAIKACRILKEKNISFHYSIVGGKINEELLFLIKRFDLEEEVSIIDRIPQKKVYEMMNSSNLLLVSSVEEGLPNVLVEAMALGVPVLSTICGGVEELIDDNENGWLVPSRDSVIMAEKIIEIQSLPEETLRHVQNMARKKVEFQHSSEKMLQDMTSLYNKVGKFERS